MYVKNYVLSGKTVCLPLSQPLMAVLEITPEIPEIAGKNTSIPAMIVYLPDNSAGRNYWLLFITYLLVRWKIFDTFNRKLRKTII